MTHKRFGGANWAAAPSRRGLIGGGAGAMALAACANGSTQAPAEAPRAGIQLYTVRDAMAADVPGTLGRIGAIGYSEVEFAGYFGHAPAEIRRMLAEAGLSAPSAHVSRELIRDDPGPLIEAAAAVGHQFLVLPWIAPEERDSIAKYEAWAEVCNAFAAQCHDAGLRFCWHNHDFEFRPIDGVVPYDVLLQRCDPALVEFQLDLFWCVHAGADPLAVLGGHGARIPTCHVKDRTADGAMVDVGAGVIDFAAIFAAHRFEHHFVEHDEPPDSMASAEASYRALAALLQNP